MLITYNLKYTTIGFKYLNDDGILYGEKRLILTDEPVVKAGGTNKRPLFRTFDGFLAFEDKENTVRYQIAKHLFNTQKGA